MKKNFMLLATIAIMATGCSQQEDGVSYSESDNAISFETYAGRNAMTKATQASNDNFEEFGVYAYQHTGTFDQNTTEFNSFMENVKVSKKGTDGWTYAETKYWPNDLNKLLSFFAYAPYHASEATASATDDTAVDNITGISTTAKGAPVISFKVNENVGSQSDLIWANALGLNQKSTTLDEGKVKLNFNHALASVGFQAKTDGDYNGVEIKITKIELTGKFYQSGNLTLYGENAAWSNLVNIETAQTYTLEGTDLIKSDALTTKAAPINKDKAFMMFIPQNFGTAGEDNANVPKLKVTYTVKQGNGPEVVNEIENDALAVYEAGKAYTITMNVKLNTIDFTANVKDWGKDAANSYEVEI